MKNIIILVGLVILFAAFNSPEEQQAENRFIEVTGSAEIEVNPDEIHLIIGIEEYWIEEFNQKSKFEDYKTKVSIENIEKELYKSLKELGIDKDQLILVDAGNYWRYRGKDFLIRKNFRVVLGNFQELNTITNSVNFRGLSSISIGSLNHTDLVDFRKEVKMEALRAADDKAAYLLKSINAKKGNVISIIEINDQNSFWSARDHRSNTMITNSESSENNGRKIKLRYEIKAKYEIM